MRLSKGHMRMAIREAARNLLRTQGGPFGACVVKGTRVIAVSRNTVLRHDATCHAEINAIRQASRELGTFDLKGCVIYSTTEPCPMCFSAIHWAGISCVVYGTRIRDAAAAGFNELHIPNALMRKLGKSGVALVPGFLEEECRELFRKWKALPARPRY